MNKDLNTAQTASPTLLVGADRKDPPEKWVLPMVRSTLNLKYMRLVFLAFPIRHTLCDQLSWSHYRTLESVENATLNEHERNLFAVKYHLNLPTVEELQLELCRERAAIEEALLLNGPETTKSVSARSSGRKRGAK